MKHNRDLFKLCLIQNRAASLSYIVMNLGELKPLATQLIWFRPTRHISGSLIIITVIKFDSKVKCLIG